MALTRTPKPKADELYVALASIGNCTAGSHYPGDTDAVRRWPAWFAPVSGGQPAIDAATLAIRADIDAAQQNRERVWYGEPEPAPEAPSRLVCVKRFTHGGVTIEPGGLFIATHPAVVSAPDAFVAVNE